MGSAMPDAEDSLVLQFHGGIADIPAADWDACAGSANPFCAHAFLLALESSGAVSPATGWDPRHAVLRDAGGRVLACAPLYVKSHSYGEYVFDWAWARAYQQAGGQYYPKLQCAIPFTPVTGPRLMVRDGEGDPDALRRTLVAGMVDLARRTRVSSLHVTFPTREEHDLMAEMGLLSRLGQQYHWENRGYGDFDDFLGALSSRKRKTIRKERERAQSQGVTLRVLTGEAIEPRHWDAFHAFYLSTVDRKWAQAYLNKAFFHRLGAVMADRVALVMGEDEATGELVCGALNLIGEDALYGRNWGASEDYKFLHFEACYYQAMDFAIARGLRWVEAGAQGEHKITRGYLPRATYSCHWIADRGFHRAVADYLERERVAVAEDMDALGDLAPFRCEDTPTP
jgi:predicted N-acyltransferase